ncbi:(d)CMP kinase [Paenibacillus chungangensis]|uniref:Cytidylate kinase n=1 Tax=Paenibacillus chungangensis TaxID=696535 RepID=A0ABW3HMW2_9BACL
MTQQTGDCDRINIAIDGPAGAGKSTVARLVAGQLGYIYIDTGAMYRAVTLSAQRLAIAADQDEALSLLLDKLEIALIRGEEGQSVLVNGEDVTADIRSLEVTREVSYYAASQSIREVLASLQREMAARKGVVMDGRDIGTHVLPDAEVKVFLTASARERALRRYKEMNNHEISLDELEAEIAKRDYLDTKREIAPLIQAEDAYVLDSSGMTIEEVVADIIRLCRTKLAEAK